MGISATGSLTSAVQVVSYCRPSISSPIIPYHPLSSPTVSHFLQQRSSTFLKVVNRRQTDFTIDKKVAPHKSKRRCAQILNALDAPLWYTKRALRKVKRLRDRIRKIQIRSLSISIEAFKINVYSDEEAIRYFRFQVKDINKIFGAMGWFAGKTQRNGFKCPPLTPCCIVSRKLSSPCR